MKSCISLGLAVAVALMFSASRASANFTLSFDNNAVFSGGNTSVNGNSNDSSVIFTAEFSNTTETVNNVSYIGVQLVLTSFLGTYQGNNTPAFLDKNAALYLNVVDSRVSALLGHLVFKLTDNTGLSDPATVSQSHDAFTADGTGGDFDLLFKYANTNQLFEGVPGLQRRWEKEGGRCGFQGGGVDAFFRPHFGHPFFRSVSWNAACGLAVPASMTRKPRSPS